MSAVKKTLAIWLALASATLAAQPIAKINGPTSSPAPGMVVLDSSGSAHDIGDPIWIVPDEVMSMEGLNGRLAIFSATAQETKVVLLCFGTGTDGKPTYAADKHTVVFGGAPVPPGPNPPIPPGPNPVPPGPNLPDGKYKLAATAYNAAMASPDPIVKQLAPQLGANFDAVATGAAGGAFPTPATMHDETYKRNLATEGANTAAFKTLGPTVQAALVAAKNNGTLVTLADHITAWREISQGLSQVH